MPGHRWPKSVKTSITLWFLLALMERLITMPCRTYILSQKASIKGFILGLVMPLIKRKSTIRIIRVIDVLAQFTLRLGLAMSWHLTVNKCLVVSITTIHIFYFTASIWILTHSKMIFALHGLTLAALFSFQIVYFWNLSHRFSPWLLALWTLMPALPFCILALVFPFFHLSPCFFFWLKLFSSRWTQHFLVVTRNSIFQSEFVT